MRGLTLLRQKASSERAEMNGEESYGEFRCRYQDAPPGARGASLRRVWAGFLGCEHAVEDLLKIRVGLGASDHHWP